MVRWSALSAPIVAPDVLCGLVVRGAVLDTTLDAGVVDVVVEFEVALVVVVDEGVVVVAMLVSDWLGFATVVLVELSAVKVVEMLENEPVIGVVVSKVTERDVVLKFREDS